MAFILYVPPPEPRRYLGIHVGRGQIAVSVNLARKLKDVGGWRRVVIYFDREKGVIQLCKTKNKSKGFAMQWQHIGANLSSVMPTGRYYLESEKPGKINLKQRP